MNSEKEITQAMSDSWPLPKNIDALLADTERQAAALLDWLDTNRFAPGSAILFLHTGGNVELFA